MQFTICLPQPVNFPSSFAENYDFKLHMVFIHYLEVTSPVSFYFIYYFILFIFQAKMKEVHRNHRKSHRKPEHQIKISSIPATPDLYEDDERQNNDAKQNEISDEKNTKIKLNVPISESPQTVQCSTETKGMEKSEVRKQDEYDQHQVLNVEGEKKCTEETGQSKTEDEKEEDESETTVSSQEDISAGGSTDEEGEDGNTYTVDE
jgi:hypothetical protein